MVTKKDNIKGLVIKSLAQFEKGKEYIFTHGDFHAMKKLGKVELTKKTSTKRNK